DIDHIYMTALAVMRRPGGWPLSMFLDAQGRPIAGGTYWPRDDFKSILQRVQDLNKKQPKSLTDEAEDVARRTKLVLAGGLPGIARPAAASMISSAAASPATAPSAAGPCPTSRRCSTTTPSCWRCTRPPTATRRSLPMLGCCARRLTS